MFCGNLSIRATPSSVGNIHNDCVMLIYVLYNPTKRIYCNTSLIPTIIQKSAQLPNIHWKIGFFTLVLIVNKFKIMQLSILINQWLI